MAVLVIAENDSTEIKPSTLNTVAAALEIDKEVTVLVAGSGCQKAAQAASAIAGVGKVSRRQLGKTKVCEKFEL